MLSLQVVREGKKSNSHDLKDITCKDITCCNCQQRGHYSSNCPAKAMLYVECHSDLADNSSVLKRRTMQILM